MKIFRNREVDRINAEIAASHKRQIALLDCMIETVKQLTRNNLSLSHRSSHGESAGRTTTAHSRAPSGLPFFFADGAQ
jgi:hypothetical protein